MTGMRNHEPIKIHRQKGRGRLLNCKIWERIYNAMKGAMQTFSDGRQTRFRHCEYTPRLARVRSDLCAVSKANLWRQRWDRIRRVAIGSVPNRPENHFSRWRYVGGPWCGWRPGCAGETGVARPRPRRRSHARAACVTQSIRGVSSSSGPGTKRRTIQQKRLERRGRLPSFDLPEFDSNIQYLFKVLLISHLWRGHTWHINYSVHEIGSWKNWTSPHSER